MLQRVLFEIENHHGAASVAQASLDVRNEVIAVWEYAGYGDILQAKSNILKKVKEIHINYKSLTQVPISRREGANFKEKIKSHYANLPFLFDISTKHMQTSSLITKEDRDFLLYHWDKTISSTKDTITAAAVIRKLEKSEKHKKYSEAQLCDSSPVPSTSNLDSSFSSQASADSGDVFLPKRVCTSFPSDSPIQIPKNIMKKMDPLADRVGVSNMQLTALTAGLINHSGGEVDNISLSKSTTRRSRATAREMGAAEPAWGRSPRKVDEQVHLLLEAIPPLSPVFAISTELAAEEEGGDHGLLHCFSLPGVLVLLTFSPWGCRE